MSQEIKDFSLMIDEQFDLAENINWGFWTIFFNLFR